MVIWALLVVIITLVQRPSSVFRCMFSPGGPELVLATNEKKVKNRVNDLQNTTFYV